MDFFAFKPSHLRHILWLWRYQSHPRHQAGAGSGKEEQGDRRTHALLLANIHRRHPLSLPSSVLLAVCRPPFAIFIFSEEATRHDARQQWLHRAKKLEKGYWWFAPSTTAAYWCCAPSTTAASHFEEGDTVVFWIVDSLNRAN